MCGRVYVKNSNMTMAIMSAFGLERYELPTLNNVAPTGEVPIVCHNDRGELDLMAMRWWLHPNWSKEPPNAKYATFNARIETVLTSPTFRGPIKQHRGILPAAGFVEWKTEGKEKQPFYVEGKTEPMAMAAIFDIWNTDLYSCAIITQPADSRFEHIHHRMPLALNIEQARQWLDHTMTAEQLIKQFQGSCIDFSIHKVDKAINNARDKSELKFLY
jgi:putative SOS response-associated peptidase YedK